MSFSKILTSRLWFSSAIRFNQGTAKSSIQKWKYPFALGAIATGSFFLVNYNSEKFSFYIKNSFVHGVFTEINRTAKTFAKESENSEQKIVITPRQKLFFQFASVEFDGIPYMTPHDFLESVTEDHPRPRIRRKHLSKEQYEMFIKNTPAQKYGSSRLFRNLEDKGLISYSEYLFLLCVISKPSTDFEIAFNMFDTDGNCRVDKSEFLVLEKIISNESKYYMIQKIFQRDGQTKNDNTENLNELKLSETNLAKQKMLEALVKESSSIIQTSLLVHFFGHKGDRVLKFENFKKFMQDLQTEVLEIEFNEFSKGMNKITCIEFAEILLRYTDFSHEKRISLIRKLQSKMDAFSRDISFEKFHQFSQFMLNLKDFQLALKFHTYANKAISEDEFQRAVKISSGFRLDPKIVEVIFNVFDENSDGQLSYKEFIAVLKGRLNRGLKSRKRQNYDNSRNYDLDLSGSGSQSDVFVFKDEQPTFMKAFKKCIRKKLREKNYE
ncbi:calcium uptake mitochondrial isoform X3 [Brachionus plicatilis]|uniref:Calcium uptake mitochondrial isoform X3 n=1 Tax=Brachionus plicatilis TaxID=10195 RepID=A0A3M7QHL4_BRAPC|nr:calcium uptake mitochondrial isoform X3 [Brachionus plicatilis]RNA10779.1 calcium uptake mitochondrial isoform X3 [Brachionus plicatilis]